MGIRFVVGGELHQSRCRSLARRGGRNTLPGFQKSMPKPARSGKLVVQFQNNYSTDCWPYQFESTISALAPLRETFPILPAGRISIQFQYQRLQTSPSPSHGLYPGHPVRIQFLFFAINPRAPSALNSITDTAGYDSERSK